MRLVLAESEEGFLRGTADWELATFLQRLAAYAIDTLLSSVPLAVGIASLVALVVIEFFTDGGTTAISGRLTHVFIGTALASLIMLAFTLPGGYSPSRTARPRASNCSTSA